MFTGSWMLASPLPPSFLGTYNRQFLVRLSIASARLFSTWQPRPCSALALYRMAQKIGTIFVRLNCITASNINRFSKLLHSQNREKICSNTITEDPTTPQVCRYTTLWNVSVSLIAPLVSSVVTRRLECVVQQQGRHIEHFDAKTAACDSYFTQ